MRLPRLSLLAPLFLVAACAAPRPTLPTAIVYPSAETRPVGTADADAADDPAIWAPPPGETSYFRGAPIPGIIAGTDKKAGLYIYGVDGGVLQFLGDGLLNNVDLREIRTDGRRRLLIGASDRSPARMGIALYLYDPSDRSAGNEVRPWGFIPADVGEPYGFCMGKVGGAVHALLAAKNGEVRQYRLSVDGEAPSAEEVRRFRVGSQSEGCVFDDEAGMLYIGEETVGLWRYGADPASGAERLLVEPVGAGRLVADVEGVTMIRDREACYLIVSSQGDSAFALWRVDGDAPVYAGRFRVDARRGIDEVTGTDGLDAFSGPIGPYPEGLVVVQDDVNEGNTQNFKLIDWRAIKGALNLT
ncbi:MAG: phytase [Allosphingosinicella sp.]|uniref:phytase n=1 Tax=Allosphingosinicella sp. TaxID=2823234 RepID=UPI0039423E3B